MERTLNLELIPVLPLIKYMTMDAYSVPRAAIGVLISFSEPSTDQLG